MRAILCMLLLWQTWAPLCMPRPIGLLYFTSSLLWQTWAPLCMPRPIGLPYFTSLLLWQTCTSLCMLHQIGLPYFTLSLRWLAFTLFTCSCCWLTPYLILMRLWHCLCSALMAPALVLAMIQTRHDTNWKLVCTCCWLTPFLILTRLWHCLCCCRNSSCSCNHHDTNPPWYKLKASCCEEGMPKR